MRSLVLFTLVIAPLSAAPAHAQSRPLSSPRIYTHPEPSLSAGQRNFSFRVNDTFGPDGSRRKRTAIIAGFDVAPDTKVGIGLFDSMPKSRGRGPDPRLDGMAKKSRKAAVGMTFRF